MAAAGVPRALPPPRRISHATNLLWWIALFAAAGVAYYTETSIVQDKEAELPTGNEREAFLAISFGKIAEQGTDVILAQNFREQVNALRSAGYTAVGLDSLEAFYNERWPLPDRPVVLLFDNVQRDSIEIVDQALAAANWRGVAFADVDATAASNIDLVSRHRLSQLADSDRWDVGVAACPPVVEEGATPPAPEELTQKLRTARTLVEQWIDRPVRAIDCERSLDKDQGGENWRRVVGEAGFRFGVVVSNPRANYIDDSPLDLDRVRVFREWSATDLLTALESRKPRRGKYVDDFKDQSLRPDWILDRADAAIEGGTLRFSAREGVSGGLLYLGGSDRWSDAEVVVTVDDAPDGQFWISLRSGPYAYVRLGVSHGKAVLQKSEDGENHQYGSREISGKSFTLGLRVVGGRATGTIDGTPVSDRPVEMPSSPERGPLTLAVWDSDGKASVKLRRIEATPLRARSAIVSGSAGEGIWNELRNQVDELAVLSPRAFAWRHGRAVGTGSVDAAISIFARHHRLHLLPAVELEQHPDYATLSAQLVRWAREDGFDGLNLLVPIRVATDSNWQRLVQDLRARLKDEKRKIAVTVTDHRGELPGALQEFGNIYAMDRAPNGAFETAIAPINLVGAPAG